MVHDEFLKFGECVCEYTDGGRQAVIVFTSEAIGNDAIAKLNNTMFHDQNITVARFEEREPKSENNT